MGAHPWRALVGEAEGAGGVLCPALPVPLSVLATLCGSFVFVIHDVGFGVHPRVTI